MTSQSRFSYWNLLLATTLGFSACSLPEILNPSSSEVSRTSTNPRPTIAITTPASDGAYVNEANQTSFTLSGTCSLEGAPVLVAVGTATATPTCTSGAFSSSLDLSSLSDGALTATVVQTNDNGNGNGNGNGKGATGIASRSLIKDVTAPTIAFGSIAPSASDASITPSVKGTTSADTTSVKLYLGSACDGTEAASGTRLEFESGSGITLTVPAAVSTNILGTAIDAAGNFSSCIAMTSYVNTATQLNGTYAVKTAGGGHYTTIIEARNALVAGGQSGPVIFDVFAGSYVGLTGAQTLGAVAGNSPTNTITFRKAPQAGGAVTTTSGFKINGPDYVTIRDFDSIGTNTTFLGGATHGLIENTTIDVVPFGRGVMISGAGNHNLTIRNVKFNVPVDGWGVHLAGQSNNLLIERCQFIGAPNSWNGIELSPFANYGGSTGIIIRNNIIRGDFPDGITLNTQYDRVDVKIHHNTIRMSADDSFAIRASQQVSNALTAEIKNNILANYGTTPSSAAILRYQSPTLSANHNLYYTPNGASIGYLAGTSPVTYPTLTEWRAAYPSLDLQSLSDDPGFMSATDLHLRSTSSAQDAGATDLGITEDFDGDARDSMPDIGADEIL